MMTVYGTDKKPAKKELTYNLQIATSDNIQFGRVDGCAPRSIVRNGETTKYDCTIVYANKSFFSSLGQSISNRFNSIIAGAKAQTFLNKSEAKAAIDKIKAADAFKKNTTISLVYKGYTTQTIEGNSLTFDYDETSAISQIKNILEADCTAAGGNFISYAEGCDLTPLPASGSSSSSSSSSSLTTTKPSTSPTRLPNATAKKECNADRGQYKGNIVSGWKCVYPKQTTLTTAQKCTLAGGTLKGSKCFKCERGVLEVHADNNQNIDGWVCQYSVKDGQRTYNYGATPVVLSI
jgi:hypothetical protein